MYFLKGKKYRYRKEAIEKWIKRDKGYEEKLKSVKESRNMRCKECGQGMRVVLKDLHDFGKVKCCFSIVMDCVKYCSILLTST